MSKCSHCPLIGQAETCRGERNNRVCQLADAASPDHSPGFLEKARNFAVAIVGHVAAGMPMATEEQKASRLGICSACEHFDNGSCRLCGCGLSVKAGWAGEACPAGKWLEIVISK